MTLPSDLLVKMDMATSAWSLEARSPLLDHVLAERVFSLPRRYLFRGLRTKALLRDAYRSELPDEVIKGAKRGFEIPLARWLETDWQPLIGETVLAPDSRVTRFVTPDTIRDVFCASTYSDRNVGYLRFALLALELWLREHERHA